MNVQYVGGIYPQRFGERQALELYGVGPTSYSRVTGDVLLLPTGLTASSVPGGFLTKSGNYVLYPFPTATGQLRPTWAFKWFYSGSAGATGVDYAVVTLGSSPTNGTYTISATAGSGSITAVVAGGVLSSVVVNNPGSYTVPPTFTPPAGLGSGATIVSSLGATGGVEVGTGTNLSSEQVQFMAIGGEM